MATIKMSVLLCLLLVILDPRDAAAAVNNVPPDCVSISSRGNVTVPFPFGLEERCALNRTLWLNCSYASSGPQLYLGENILVRNISLENATMVVSIDRAFDCYNASRMRTQYFQQFIILRDDGPYTVSNTRNKFTVLGCDTLGLFTDANETFGSGCFSICSRNITNFTEVGCTGVGCCQTTIPKRLKTLSILIGSHTNYSEVYEFNPCGLAFVVDEDQFDISKLRLPTTDDTDRQAELALDWVVDHVRCEQAVSNSTGACKENSDCQDYDNGEGYRCFCQRGYKGNPYLSGPDGCQDIDECRDPDKYPCHGTCKNKPGNYTCHCPFGKTGDGKTACEISLLTVIVAAVASIIFCIATGALIWVWWKKKTREKYFKRNGGHYLTNQGVKIFTETQINKATNNFDETLKIGESGLGSFYKGMMLEADIVDHELQTNPENPHMPKADANLNAVKKCEVVIKKAKDVRESQVNLEFHAEIKTLSQINHRNVVRLLGICLDTRVPMLVFQYVSNGSLHGHIYGKNKSGFLSSLKNRLRVAVEIALGLQYLHFEACKPVIHGDIKSKNILLDDYNTVKISDFCASLLISPGKNVMAFVEAKGNPAYLDPEFLLTKALTTKSDVYSFGVVLVELLTGKTPDNTQNPIVKSFKSVEDEETLSHLINLEKVDEDEMKEIVKAVAKIAKNCLNDSSNSRPEMKDVAEQLAEIYKRAPAKHQDDIKAATPEAKPSTSQLISEYCSDLETERAT